MPQAPGPAGHPLADGACGHGRYHRSHHSPPGTGGVGDVECVDQADDHLPGRLGGEADDVGDVTFASMNEHVHDCGHMAGVRRRPGSPDAL